MIVPNRRCPMMNHTSAMHLTVAMLAGLALGVSVDAQQANDELGVTVSGLKIG